MLSMILPTLIGLVLTAEPMLEATLQSSQQDADGEAVFAMVVRDPSAMPDDRPMQVCFLVDLSARVTPAERADYVRLVGEIAHSLPAGSRVHVILPNRAGQALTSQPLEPADAEWKVALAKLESEPTVGTMGADATMESLTRWLDTVPAEHVRQVIALGPCNPNVLGRHSNDDDMIARLRAANTCVSWIQPTEAERSFLLNWVLGTGGAHRTLVGFETASFVESLRQPVTVIDRIDTDPATEAVLPTQLTLTGDRATVLMGRWRPAEGMTVRLVGHRGTGPVQWVAQAMIDPNRTDDPTGQQLRFLHDQWSQEPNRPMVLGGRAGLALAAPWLETQKEIWSAQAAQALRRDDPEAAENLWQRVLEWEPDHLEAQLGLTAARQQESAEPVEEPARDVPADDLEAARARESILKQQLKQSVNEILREARLIGRDDAAGAIRSLKLGLERVAASRVDERTQASLREDLEREIRTQHLRAIAQSHKEIERHRILAQSDARRRLLQRETSRQQQIKVWSDQVRALLAEAETKDAARQARANVVREPDQVATVADDLHAELSDRYARIEEVEYQKQRGWWDTLMSVEQSSPPQPDDAEIVFPSAQRWEALTVRREKFRSFDLSGVSETEKQIRGKLVDPISVDFRDVPLEQVIEFLRERTGVNIIQDDAELEAVGVNPDEPISLQLEAIPFKSLLKLMLTPLDLAYIVENDVLLITSQERARLALQTKVYDVADLVIPIRNFNGGGGAGGTTQQNATGIGTGNSGVGGPQGGQGAGFRRDISDELKQILKAVNGDQASSENPWEEYLREHDLPPAQRSAVLSLLMQRGQPREAVRLARAVIRHRANDPAMRRVLARLSMIGGESVEDVRDAILSLVDADRGDWRLWIESADLLAEAGLPKEAKQLFARTIEVFGPSDLVLERMLDLADQQNDGAGVVEAVDALLDREWANDDGLVHDRVVRRAQSIEKSWRNEGREDDARRLADVATASRARDLEIVLVWEGSADLDLTVIEPDGIYCSPLTPRTVGGGVLHSSDIETHEQYVAARAYPGDYDILIKPVWGTPTAGIVNLDIVLHAGTPGEVRERRTVRVQDLNQPVIVHLDEGRRQHPDRIGPESGLVGVGPKDDRLTPLGELRQLIGPTPPKPVRPFQPPLANFITGSRSVPFVTGVQSAVSGGAVAFDPVVTAITDGTTLTAQAIVSHDRRFVRLQLVPLVQSVEAIQDVRTIDVGGAAR